MRKPLLLLLLFLTSLTLCSCARTLTLHPVTNQDIKEVDGWICMTPKYVEQVVQVKLKEKGL